MRRPVAGLLRKIKIRLTCGSSTGRSASAAPLVPSHALAGWQDRPPPASLAVSAAFPKAPARSKSVLWKGLNRYVGPHLTVPVSLAAPRFGGLMEAMAAAWDQGRGFCISERSVDDPQVRRPNSKLVELVGTSANS